MVEDLHPEDPPEIGPYRLRGRLGTGGMGVVYLGFSPKGHARAIKVPHRELARDSEFRRRFAAEVAAASRVSGPGVAEVVASDPDADLPWLASEYVPGTTLDQAVATQPLPTDAVRTFASGLAEALAAIHAAGVVHRDLKPANVLHTPTGPRVVDFGIATAGHTRMTSTGVIIGSPGWIAPERIRGQDATPASDVWAWGACVAYAATGHSPFGADTPDADRRPRPGRPTRPHNLPDNLAPLVTRALASNPSDRPTARELADLLADDAAHRAAPQPEEPEEPWRDFQALASTSKRVASPPTAWSGAAG